MTCSASDVPLTANAYVACDASGGNAYATPAALFVNAGGLNYQLAAGSPAIDAGTPGPLPADEATTDYALAPRLVDGDLDCVAVADQGAYELQGQSLAACPAPPETTTPAPATPAPTPAAKTPRSHCDDDAAPAARARHDRTGSLGRLAEEGQDGVHAALPPLGGRDDHRHVLAQDVQDRQAQARLGDQAGRQRPPRG